MIEVDGILVQQYYGMSSGYRHVKVKATYGGYVYRASDYCRADTAIYMAEQLLHKMQEDGYPSDTVVDTDNIIKFQEQGKDAFLVPLKR